jgi:hypothetical protein
MAQEEGPDRIIPTDNLTTWKQDGCVKLRTIPEFPGNRDSMSLVTFTKKQCLVLFSDIFIISNTQFVSFLVDLWNRKEKTLSS